MIDISTGNIVILEIDDDIMFKGKAQAIKEWLASTLSASNIQNKNPFQPESCLPFTNAVLRPIIAKGRRKKKNAMILTATSNKDYWVQR